LKALEVVVMIKRLTKQNRQKKKNG